MKRFLSMLLVVIMTASLAIGGTLAYLTDTETLTNTVTIGDVDIDLDEPSFDQDEDHPMLPGVAIPKDPEITNVGDNPAWVWMTVSIPNALYPHLDFDFAADWNKDAEVDTETDPGNTIVTLKYPTLLEKDGKTTPAFTEVTLKDYIDVDDDGNLLDENGDVIDWNINQNPDADIVVTAYAIQDKPFANVDKAYDAYHGKKDFVVENDVTLTEALLSSGTIAVEADITDGDLWTVEENIETSIDLQNHSLNGTLENRGGEVAISNGTISNTAVGFESFGGEAELNDVTVKAGSSSDYAANVKGGTATFNNTDIPAAGGGMGITNGSKVVFNGGEISVGNASTSGRYCFYIVGDGSELTIKDGSFSFKSYTNKRAYVYAGAGTTVNIQGGTFGPAANKSGYTAGILGEGTIIITGGTFGFDPSNWVADGYQAVKSGDTWTVSAM